MIQWATGGFSWQVNLTGGAGVTNERGAGISGSNNPNEVNPWWTMGMVTFLVRFDDGPVFTNVRVFAVGTGLGSPPLGAPREAVASILAALAPGEAVSRAVMLQFSGGTIADPHTGQCPMPSHWILEYDTVTGGPGLSTLDVIVRLMGPEITGRE